MKNKKNLLIALLMLIFSLCACVTEHVHFFTEKVIPPTCTDVGYTLYKCRCGEEYKDNEVPKTDHEYGEWYIVKEATEHEKGLKEKKCIYCDNKIEETIDELPHSHVFSDWKVINNETSSDPGLKERKCEGCGYIEQTTVVDLSDMELVLDKTYFIVNLNETFTEILSGIITDGKKTYQLNSDEIYVSRNAYQKLGIYSLSVTAIFHDYRFRQDIELEVKNYLVEEEKSKLPNNKDFTYIFEWENYIFYSDNSKLYQYDLIKKEIVSRYDLKGIANGHYIYDEFLFVSAHDINNTAFLKDEKCKGTVTQIDLNTFSVYKQVTLKTYPKGIVVDKRGDVIIGKGNHYGRSLCSVNMETGEFTRICSMCDYDFIFYHEVNDVIFVYSLGTTPSGIYRHPYFDGFTSSNIHNIEVTVYKLLKYKNNITIQADSMGYFEYSDKPHYYSNMCFTHYSIKDSANRHYKYESADLDENYVYFVCRAKEREGVYDKIIMKSVLYSDDYVKYDVKIEEDCEILYTYSYENRLYLVTSLGELIVLKNE